MKLDPKRSREISDFVNNRVNIVDVLKVAGIKLTLNGGTWQALCPFHEDKETASFRVNKDANYVHCFGCNKTWYPVLFVMEYENCRWGEAVRRLAAQYSINLSEFERELTGNEKTIQAAREINRVAAEWMHQQIKKYPQAEQYLLSRYDQESIDKWGLGYCPSGEKLIQYLIKKCKFDYNIVQKIDIRSFIFHDRIVYPIHDVFGNVVGFSCRIWALSKEEEEKKYLNDKNNGFYRKFVNTSAKSILFKFKSSNLYGLNFARKALRKSKGTIVLSEGPSDVILMHKSGIEYCAGTMSLAFNKHTLATLADISVRKVVFCMDGDSSGQKRTLELMAAQKKLAAELPEDSVQIQYKAVSIPGGQDPEEFLSDSANIAVMKKMVDNAMTLPEFYIHYERQKKPVLETISDKLDFIFDIRRTLTPVMSRAEMTTITHHLRQELGISRLEFYEYSNLRGHKIKLKRVEERLLAWLIEDKELRDAIIDRELTPEMFSYGYAALYRIIRELHRNELPDLKSLEEEGSKINIDSIVARVKQLRILSSFSTENDLRDILARPVDEKRGLIQEFKDHAKQGKVRAFVTNLSEIMNEYTAEELLDYIKYGLASLEQE